MSKKLKNLQRALLEELECFSRFEGSYVVKVNHTTRSCLDPKFFQNNPKLLKELLYGVRVGRYDPLMGGMVIDFKNIQHIGSEEFPENDSMFDQLFNADWYIFRPTEFSLCSGIVQRVGDMHLELTIFGVVKARVRFQRSLKKQDFPVGSRAFFRIKSFDMQHDMVYMYGRPAH